MAVCSVVGSNKCSCTSSGHVARRCIYNGIGASGNPPAVVTWEGIVALAMVTFQRRICMSAIESGTFCSP